MTDDLKIWLPPMFTLLGTLIVVVFTAWLNSRAIFAHIEALRFEVRADMSELRGEVRKDMSELRGEFRGENAAMKLEFAAMKLEFATTMSRIENKLDHVVETQARHSERLDKLNGGRS